MTNEEKVSNEPQTEPVSAPVEPRPAPAPEAPPQETRAEEYPRAEAAPALPGAPIEQAVEAAADEAEEEDRAETETEVSAGPSAPAGSAPAAPAGAPRQDERRGQDQRQGGQQQERQGGGRRRRRGRGGRGGGEGRGGGRSEGQPSQDQNRGQRQEGRGERRGQEQQRQGGRGEHGERRGGEQGRGRGERERAPQETAPRAERGPKKPVKREILANTSFEETRIAIVEDGRLAELHWERKSAQNIVGNIYKGVVENVLPGISSAFVNIGYEKNAYLYISDVLGERGAAIDATLKKGQHIMVQVAKEAIGTKGMKVTMDVSLPGRYTVFTPFQDYVGISKHIADPEERKRLEAIVDKLVKEVLGGKGVVVRTEAEGATAEELEREVRYLMQSWEQIHKKYETDPPPTLLHKDLDLSLQVARDILSEEVYVYLVDNKETYKNVVDFVNGISPELAGKVRLYEARTPIFKAFTLEPEIENLRKSRVPLPNGGSLIIQEAESLCAIDVNTGRFTGSKSQEETVTQTNIEAAVEVAHQLRLRNIGGIIVVDFIDMRKASNRNKVMEAFAQATKGDRAKIRILPITRLGLIELTRERKRESTVSLITDECPECKGAGRVLSAETIRIRVQREIFEMTGGRPGGQVRVLLHPGLAEQFRAQQALIEKNVQRGIKVQSDPNLRWEDYRIVLE